MHATLLADPDSGEIGGVNNSRAAISDRVRVGFRPGDGASATTAMTHIAIQEQLNGKAVDWLEHVSDEQYRAGSK